MPPVKKQLPRQSTRLISLHPQTGIDEAARRRRIQRHLETLEKDNFQDDPHANIVWNKSAPKFDDELIFSRSDETKKRKKKSNDPPSKISAPEHATKKGKKLVASLTKTRFRKTFTQLLIESEKKWEEDKASTSSTTPSSSQQIQGSTSIASSIPPFLTYTQITPPPSLLPPRKFCAVCGLKSCYTCVKCGAHFCSIPCRDTHVDTRCLKWTV
uniref:HIT-type domain-containing protein n=1 Tax=Meloidogyne incognita TaxID=6306 RepID=A0A914LGT5_MELIC